MKEVEGRVHDILSLRFQLQVSELNIQLSRKFKAYNSEKSKVELATSRFNSVPKETLRESLWVKLIDVVF